MLILAAVFLVVLLGAGAGFLVLRHLADPARPVAVSPAPTTVEAPDPEPTYVDPPATTSPPTESTPDPEAGALTRLDQLSVQGLAAVTLDGQWVAQLASKYPGINDPHQTTASGSHVFTAADIFREHETLRTDPLNGGAQIVLLKSTDYGKRQRIHGEPLYVTFALNAFATEQAVRGWCGRRFADLTGDDLENQCAVRRLRPPV